MERVKQLEQVSSMDGNIVATFRLVAVASPTKIVGVDAVVVRQGIGKSLKTEGIGGEAMYADNRPSVLTPLDAMKVEGSCRNKIISHRIQGHWVLLGVGVRGCSIPFPTVTRAAACRGLYHRCILEKRLKSF